MHLNERHVYLLERCGVVEDDFESREERGDQVLSLMRFFFFCLVVLRSRVLLLLDPN